MDEKKDMTNNELKIFVNERFNRIDEKLKDIKSELKNLDADIRGNGGGKIGLNVRIDRLETAKKYLFWVASVVSVAAINHFFGVIDKLIGKLGG